MVKMLFDPVHMLMLHICNSFNTMKPFTRVFADGSCLGNPGPGGYAVVFTGGLILEHSGSEAATTNNRMELQAVISACQIFLDHSGVPGELEIITDSKYVYNGITKWIKTWKANGWSTSLKKKVQNAELWMLLDRLVADCRPCWLWIPGHQASETEHSRADELARKAATTEKMRLKGIC